MSSKLNRCIYNYIYKKKTEKRKIKKNSINLYNGEYVYNNALNCVFLNNKITKQHVDVFINNDPFNVFNIKNYLIKKALFNESIVIDDLQNEKSDFIGTIYFFSKNNNDDKIFDLNNNRVKLLYSDSSKCQKKIDTYNHFKEYFNLPKILKYDTKSLIEELINFKNAWTTADLVFIVEEIFSKYVDYFSRCGKEDVDYLKPNLLLDKIHEDKYYNFFRNNITEELLNLEFPTFKLHGDLRRNNILFEIGNKKVYLIDWEFTANYFMFYDVFFFMYHEARFNGNTKILLDYFAGTYDRYFFQISSVFNFKYDERKKSQYFNIFFLEHFVKKAKYSPSAYNYYNYVISKLVPRKGTGK